LDRCRHRSDCRGDAGVRLHQTDLDDGQCAALLEFADHHWCRAGAPSDGQSLGGYTVSSAFNTGAGQPLIILGIEGFRFALTKRRPLRGTAGSIAGWSSACRAYCQETASVPRQAFRHRNALGVPSTIGAADRAADSMTLRSRGGLPYWPFPFAGRYSTW
jgi:hypothetical protein